MKNVSGIYEIVNIVTQKRYIGLASSLNGRKQQHLYALRRDIHANDYLQKAWNKYGEASFVFNCIEECDTDGLYEREDYWVRVLNVLDSFYGYNIKETDPNGKSIWTEERKQKMSIHHKEKGIKPSIACIEASKVYNKTERAKVHVIKMREKLKDIDYFEVHKVKRKRVMHTITGYIYESLGVASDKLGVPKYELSRRILGKRKNNTNLIYLD